MTIYQMLSVESCQNQFQSFQTSSIHLWLRWGIWDQGYFNLRHIGTECVDMALIAVDSTTWSFRGQGLKALEELTASGSIGGSSLKKLSPVLERKYFNGKESIIKAVANIGTHVIDIDDKLTALEMILSETENGTNIYKKAILSETLEMIQSFDAEAKSKAKTITDKFTTENAHYDELKNVFKSW